MYLRLICYNKVALLRRFMKKIVFIEGLPGVGKTYLVNEIRKLCLKDVYVVDEIINQDIENPFIDSEDKFLLNDEMIAEEKLEGVSPDLLELPKMTKEIAAKLAEQNIKTRDDLADLSVDELIEITGVSANIAKEMIMKAREYWDL